MFKPEDEETNPRRKRPDKTEASDDTETEDEIPEPESTISKCEPWDRIMKRAHDALQEDFDDAVERYLQQNPGMALDVAEENAYEELRKDYGQADPAGTVLLLSSAACNVTTKIGDRMYMCWMFRVFCSNLFHSRAWSAFIFCMHCI